MSDIRGKLLYSQVLAGVGNEVKTSRDSEGNFVPSFTFGELDSATGTKGMKIPPNTVRISLPKGVSRRPNDQAHIKKEICLQYDKAWPKLALPTINFPVSNTNKATAKRKGTTGRTAKTTPRPATPPNRGITGPRSSEPSPVALLSNKVSQAHLQWLPRPLAPRPLLWRRQRQLANQLHLRKKLWVLLAPLAPRRQPRQCKSHLLPQTLLLLLQRSLVHKFGLRPPR